MKENWYALCISILSNLEPDQAFELFYANKQRKQRQSNSLTDADTQEMIRLRETKTYKEIGEIFGITDKVVYARIKRFKSKGGEVVIDKGSAIDKELMETFGEPPVKVTITADEDEKIIGGDAAITIVHSKKGFEVVNGGFFQVLAANKGNKELLLELLEQIKQQVLRG